MWVFVVRAFENEKIITHCSVKLYLLEIDEEVSGLRGPDVF